MSRLLPGVHISGVYTAVVILLFWTLANFTLKPLLILLTLPVQFLTLGFASVFINGFIFWLLATFIKGFEVVNFWWALAGAAAFSFVSAVVNKLT